VSSICPPRLRRGGRLQQNTKMLAVGGVAAGLPLEIAAIFVLLQELLMCDHAHLEVRNGNREQAIAYCTKADTRMIGPETDFLLDTEPQTKRTGLDSPYKKAMEAPDYDAALGIIREAAPRDFVIYNSAISNTMKKLFQEELIPNVNFIFNIEKLDQELLTTKAIVITGVSGAGKTQFALSHFQKPLLCSHSEDLKKLRPKYHDGIVFDDMTFSHWPPQSCIHLLDMELPRSINVKYGSVNIPAKLPRFFTSNRDFRQIFSAEANEAEWLAIERRSYVLDFQEPLFN